VPASSICFHTELPLFKLKRKTILRDRINQTILSSGKRCGCLNFIFCSDEFLLDINKRFLKHDYFTDVITFDYSSAKTIAGDIYISIDRVTENAKKEKQIFETELGRVMIHGVLHLMGYVDKEKTAKALMRKKEDKFISLLNLNK
jgi:probable rRNA maturation factor